MYILLPVEVYDKSSNVPFSVDINNDSLVINTINDTKVHNIILCNFSYGIVKIPVSFPLTFLIVKNEIICDQFYIFKVLSSHNDFDFLNTMINEVNKIYNKKFSLYKNMNLMNLINLLKLYSNNDNNDIQDEIVNKVYYRVCRYLNFCLAMMVDGNTANIADTSKILQIINAIKQIKISFYGNILSVEEHIEFITNPHLIKKKRFYFYESNNKIIKKYIGDNISVINKTDFKPYPNKFNNLISIKNLLNTLIINNFPKLFDIASRVLYKKKQNIIIMSNSFLFDNHNYIEFEIANGNYNNLHELSFEKFKNIIDNNIINNNNLDYQLIVNKILENNIYPISFDKKTINEYFIKLLYLTIKNDDIIQHINNKFKSILLFTLKIYKYLVNEDISIIFNYRIYNEALIYQIIKIFIFNDTHKLLVDLKYLPNIRQKFINNIIIIQILTNLSWKTISKQFSLFKYLISMKQTCKDLIIIDGKINKTYTQNMDNRLKKIIIEPLQMFNYLKKEEDVYKWIFNFKELIPKIFYNMITLEGTDYKKLAKILYNYSKIKNQNMDDEYYKKLLCILKIDSKLVLFNDRINIKFKDLFKNININLGYLARDIVNEEIISVTISEEVTDNNNSNVSIDTIHKLKKKYYKYKGKYLEMRMSSVNDTINEN
jgi:hypothetical protein